jgi:tetratricopeptide (TPR) repeat protein
MAVLVLVIGVTFWPSLQNGFTNWDDPDYLTANPLAQTLSWQNLQNIFFSDYCSTHFLSPLVVATFAVEHHFFGQTPTGYHATNLILHMLNTLLVFWIFRRLSSKSAVGLICALLFGIHPLRVESVAWISERKDVLAAFFFLASCLAYLRHQETGRRHWYLATFLFFILSLVVKPLAITLPFVFLGFDFIREKPLGKKTLLEKIPFFATSLFLAAWMSTGHKAFFADNPAAAAIKSRHFFYGAYAVCWYLEKIFWPVKLSCLYPMPKKTDGFLPLIYLASPSLCLFLAAGLAILARRTKKIIFGGFFFLITLLPAIAIIPFNASIVFDRYAYLPCIGIFYLAGEGLVWLLEQTKKYSRPVTVLLTIFFCNTVVILGFLTFDRCQVWKNDLILWQDAVSKYPQIAMAHLNRGNALCIRGQLEQALQDYNRALEIRPRYGDAYFGRGNLYLKKGDYAKAIPDLTSAIRLKSHSFEAAENLDKAYIFYAETIEREIDENPQDAQLFYNKGVLDENQKQFEKALSSYTQAIALDPNLAEAFNNRGNLYYEKGLYEKARSDYEQSIRINPRQQEALVNLKMTLKKISK